MTDSSRTVPPFASASGEVVAVLQTRNFLVTEVAYPAGYAIPVHLHDRPTVVCCLQGSFVEHIGDEAVECDERLVIIKRTLEPHSDTYPLDCRLLIVEPTAATLLCEIGEVFSRTDRVPARSLRPHFLRIWSELHSRDSLAAFAVDAKVCEVVADLLRTRQRETDRGRIGKALDILHDSFPDQVDLTSLAAACGLPTRSFARQFQRELGCTVTEYLRRLRVEKAKERLRSSDADILAVAFDLGYYDQSHFTNAFRRRVGMTPSQYRRNPS